MRRSAILLAVVPAAWAAFVLLTGAAVIGLSRVLPLDLVLAVFGVVYAAAAVVGALMARTALRALPAPLNDSATEVSKTLAVVDPRAPGALAHG